MSAKPAIESFGLVSQYCPVILAIFRRAKRTAGLVWLLLALSSFSINACLEPNGADDTLYQNLGAQYQGAVLQMRTLVPGIGAGFRNSSATFLNRNFAITAAHTFYDLIQYNPTFEFGDGLNYLTNRGILMHATSFWIYPGYNGANGASVPDLAIIKFDSPYFASSDKTIRAVSTDEKVISAGFGDWGTPNSVASNGLTRDGQIRGWEAPVMPFTLGGYSQTYYQSSLFPSSPNGMLIGQGANRDSGSPVFNTAGELLGISVAGDLSYTQPGATEFLILSQTNVYAWIQNLITPPEPKILSLTREGADVRLVWQGKGGSNYVVQAASTLGGTNTFVDLSAPLTLPGSGLVTTNYLDAGALTNAPARFYRIRLD